MQARNLINGEWIAAASGREFDVTNPATDDLIARVPDCERTEARAAIAAAAGAFDGWRTLPALERAAPLRRLADLMLRDQERLACLMTDEQGKPLTEARGEIAYAASFVEWAAEEAKRIYGEMIPASKPDKRILILRQPIGVVAAITPWNFPAAMITRKAAPALACGCTIVVKPAQQTPLCALAIGELAVEAGLPPGVLNIVTAADPKPFSEEIFANPVVRHVSFTGSTEVGKILMRQAADRVVRLSLELGGHAPFIVFEDADVDAAVTGAVATKMRNMGQTCVCANRFYIHERIYDEFAAKLQRAFEQMKIGPGWEEGVQVGPLIDDAGIEKVDRHVNDARDRGATIRCGGKRVRPSDTAFPGCGPAGKPVALTDRFYAPTIIEDFTPEMLVSCEETFGPVAPLRRFREEREAIESANDSPYGLAAYFYTRDAARLIRVAEALEFGVIGANDGLPSTAQAPFGGVKQSGFGREGGKYVMEEYTEIKYVSWVI